MSAAFLNLRALEVAYPTQNGLKTVLGPVSFSLAPGEALGIIGESGSGKSTIVFALLDLLPPSATVPQFDATLGDIELHTLSRQDRRSLLGPHIAYIPQEPMSALNPTLRIWRQVDMILSRHLTTDPQDRQARFCDVLSRLGIADPNQILTRYPSQLSGGQVQRILIAQALTLKAPLILADEPTTALDVTVQNDVLKDLRSAVDDTGTALIFISHSIGTVASLCDRVIVMKSGGIVETCTARDILSAAQHPYTKTLLKALPALSPPRTRLMAAP